MWRVAGCLDDTHAQAAFAVRLATECRREGESRLGITGRNDIRRSMAASELKSTGHIVGVSVGLEDQCDARDTARIDERFHAVDVPWGINHDRDA